jgi:type I restriction enzyme S subunit
MKKSRSTKKPDVSASLLETEKVDGTPALVPKLRFPGFVGDWSAPPLGTVVKEYRKSSSVQDEYEVLTSARRGLIRQTEYYGVGRITERDNVGFNVIPADYITYRSRSDDGLFYFNHNNLGMTGIISVYYPVFHLENGSNAFLVTLLNRFSALIGSHSVGTSQRVLPISKLLRVTLPIPEPYEQQKIADCLSSLDELIGEQGRKVDALRTHKKGLMQQLFPREGETQPQLRFPEFQDAGDWEDGALQGKTNKIGSGITPTGGERNYKKSGRPFVRSQNVGWGTLILNDIAFIDDATHATFDSTEIKANDVLLNITGASIGRCAVADDRIAAGNVNQHVCIIRVKPDELNPFFLNHFLISERGQKQIDSFQAGGNRQGLNFAQIRSFAIPLPPEKREQQHIAACLSSLDDLITAETQKLEALKTHKRGLMQQMFPSPEEA